MQLSNDFVIVSKDVSTDQNDSMVTIFKIIDGFNFGFREQDFKQAFRAEPGAKVVLPATYSIATSWSLKEKTTKEVAFRLKISIIDPKGKELDTILQEAAIAKGSDRMRFNLNTQGIPATESGRYSFIVTALDDNGKELARGDYSVNVSIDIQADK